MAAPRRSCGLRELDMHYVIRFRSNIRVTDSSGFSQPAQAWVPKNHRAKRLRGAGVTAEEFPVGAVVLIKDREMQQMQQAWCLATSRTDLTSRQVIDLYAKRFSCEETFRDTKNAHLERSARLLARFGRLLSEHAGSQQDFGIV